MIVGNYLQEKGGMTMSQMPDKIWLHKDTKYNTGDIVSAYQYEFAQKIEDEGIENFVEYINKDLADEKLSKLKELADNMYYAAQYLTTDASRLHKAMENYRNYIICKLKEE